MVVLGVYVRSVHGLAKPINPYVEVKFDGKTYATDHLNNTTEGVLDALLLIEVKQPKGAGHEMKIKVVDDQKLRKDPTLGKSTINVASILADPSKFNVRTPYSVADAAGVVVGHVEMQFFAEKVKPTGPLNVLCCSWNVGNAAPPKDLSTWLRGVSKGEHHVVAIAAQECSFKVEKGEKGLGGEAPDSPRKVEEVEVPRAATPDVPEDEVSRGVGSLGKPKKIISKLKHKMKGVSYVWENHLIEAMGDQYWRIESLHMGQIRLVVFVRVDMASFLDLSAVKTDEEATGIGHVVSNKGGVGINVRVAGTDLTFVGCHLAAHQDKTKNRNENFREIIGGLDMDPYDSDVATYPHHTFWMGDLNYRLDYGAQAKTFDESPTPEDWSALVAEIDTKAYEPLLQLDQLQKEIKEGRVLTGFREGAITFAPTFKVERAVPPNSKGAVYYGKKRSPAWTDRILVRSSLPHKQATIGEYFSAPEINTSDHKPVGCVFNVPLALNSISNAGDSAGPDKFQVHISGLTSKGPWVDNYSEWDEVQLVVAGPGVEGTSRCSLSPTGALKGSSLTVPMLTGTLQQLMDERLVLNIEAMSVDGVSIKTTLGRGLLPLVEAAHSSLEGGGKAADTPFKMDFSKHGIVVGSVEGSMKLHLVDPAAAQAKKKPSLLARLGGKK